MNTRFCLRDTQGVIHPIDRPFLIGRSPECQLRLIDQAVSRRHALVWVNQGKLFVRDEGTSNGTCVNGKPIPAGQPVALQEGSRLEIGQTSLVVCLIQQQVQAGISRPVVVKQHSRSQPLLWWLVGGAGVLMIGVLIVVVALVFTRGGLANFWNRSGVQVSSGLVVQSTSQPPAVYDPGGAVSNHAALAAAVTNLNQAEMAFVISAGSDHPLPEQLDEGLKEVAARAIQVAMQAEELGRAAAAYGVDGASQYYAIARLSYALVIEAQNTRSRLQAQQISGEQAAQVVARYGVRLWNPAVGDDAGGNPFYVHLAEADTSTPARVLSADLVQAFQRQQQGQPQVETWLASFSTMDAIELDLPALGAALYQPVDASVLNSLSSAVGQTDSTQALLAAAKKLVLMLPYDRQPPSGDQPFRLKVPVYLGLSLVDADQVAAGLLPAYDQGTASVLAKKTDDDEAFVSAIFGLNLQAPPQLQSSIPVVENKPVVTLQIRSVKETGRFDNYGSKVVMFDVQVSWQTSFTDAQLDIGCLGGVTSRTSGSSGTVKVSAAASVDEQGQALINCRASRPASFVDSIADAALVVRVGSPQAELAPTPSQPIVQVHTETPQAPQTPTFDATAAVVSTQVAVQQTAEFNATVTSAANATQAARQAGIITLNGTFGINQPEETCSPGLYTSGTLVITVNYGTSTASGSLTGGGSASFSQVVCGDMVYDMVCSQSYNGSFSGGIETVSGAVSLLGTVSGKQTCTFTNCKQNGVPFTCQDGALDLSGPVLVQGNIDQQGGAGKGTVTTCPGCQGDWSAGQ